MPFFIFFIFQSDRQGHFFHTFLASVSSDFIVYLVRCSFYACSFKYYGSYTSYLQLQISFTIALVARSLLAYISS